MLQLSAGVLAGVGIGLIALGIGYFIVAAGSLPSYVPGHVAGSLGYRTQSGNLAITAGILALGLGVAGMLAARRRHSA
jgi:hypothetical protein